MSLKIDFLAGADEDLQRAFNEFEDYQEGLGFQFLTAVEAYLARIATFPEIAPIYLGQIRRQVMAKFPFGIFYEVHPTRIPVVAILNLHQSKERIAQRLGYGED